MGARGFVNNPKEWWHFALPDKGAPPYDAPIER
jgi:D-alanyl-D-alanine dipeptidase